MSRLSVTGKWGKRDSQLIFAQKSFVTFVTEVSLHSREAEPHIERIL